LTTESLALVPYMYFQNSKKMPQNLRSEACDKTQCGVIRISGADGRVVDELVGLVKNHSFPGIGV